MINQFKSSVLNTMFVSLTFMSLPIQAEEVTRLDSDGPNHGLKAYDLIRNFGGPKSIESPDLYPGNHTEVEHILERTDDIVGHHFVFLMHKNEDKDRDKFKKFNDRQRNEIKAYGRSDDKLKGFEGDTMSYSWNFKIGDGMTISKNFSHFFQLKSVDDTGIGMPTLTISAKYRHGEESLFLSHAALKKATPLVKVPWKDVVGKWLQVHCTVTYADQGSLKISVVELENQKEVFSYQSDNIDMWRGTQSSHFVRPKWGIYRSLKSKEMLRDDEEEVSFSNFKVIKH